jgi:hypothetical protein
VSGGVRVLVALLCCVRGVCSMFKSSKVVGFVVFVVEKDGKVS